MSIVELEKPTDSELISRTEKGDVSAYGCLYDRYVEQIFRYIYFRVNNQQETEDMVETVFLKTFEQIKHKRLKIEKFNLATVSQSIPLKFRLLDYNSNPVTNLARRSVKVTVSSLACSPGTPVEIEEYSSGADGLQNLGDGFYQFNWRTPANYANTCKTMHLDIGEGFGNEHTALFQFKKK
jgi:hypothetical protein